MNLFKKMMIVGAAVAGTLGTANAATVVATGNTTGQPTYNRTVAGNPPISLSAVGSSVAYQAFGFTVDQAGSYTLSLNSTFDNFLTLYQGVFNPSSPLTNALEANDDTNGVINLNASITRNLLTGTSYTAVATAFANGASGSFTLTGSGPGTASFGTSVAAVPEPATWAMMLIGFGFVGASLRRRQLRSDAAFTAKMRRIAAGEAA